MADSNCWIDFKRDPRLRKRAEQGWYGESSTSTIWLMPGPCPKNGYWTQWLLEWCTLRGIPYKDENYLTATADRTCRARVTQAQIKHFISFMYDDEPSYNDPARMTLWKGHASAVHRLVDLEVFVASELSPTRHYDLVADVFS